MGKRDLEEIEDRLNWGESHPDDLRRLVKCVRDLADQLEEIQKALAATSPERQ